MQYRFIFLCLLFTSVAAAQNLTGTWAGSGTMGTEYVRLVVVKINNEYIGYTYDRGAGYCKANFKGKFDESSQSLKGKGAGFIENSGLHSQGVYNLKYSFENGQHILKGHVTPKSVATKVLSLGIPVHITLSRVSNDIDTTDYIREKIAKRNTGPEGDDEAVVAAPGITDSLQENILLAKQTRLADTLQVISTAADKIKIRIFDNGIMDGDSISVLYNSTPVVLKAVVSTNPLEFEINLDKTNPQHTIILIAHNLGSIPPNTATVLIQAGDAAYRINASSDFTKNALIVIKHLQ